MNIPDRYSDEAVWLLINRQSGYRTRIHGGLAAILEKYPEDYQLRLLNIRGGAHGHVAATGQ